MFQEKLAALSLPEGRLRRATFLQASVTDPGTKP
jgi:hypothetical protein